MKMEDMEGFHLYGVRNGEIRLDGTLDKGPYLMNFFGKLGSTDWFKDAQDLLYHIREAERMREIRDEDIPAVTDQAVFLLYLLGCSDMGEDQLSDMANDEPGYVASIAFDQLFKERGRAGMMKNTYSWHLVLWRIYCLEYNRDPSPVLGELFLCQYFSISEIILNSGDIEKAERSFRDVIRLGEEIRGQSEMQDDSVKMLGISWYYLASILRDRFHDEVQAEENFSEARSCLSRFRGDPAMADLLSRC